MKFLTSIQEKAILLLSKSPLKNKFYWTGGTLLAYHYLHHRKSLDLDFFSEQQFSFDEVNIFVQRLKDQIGCKQLSSEKIYDRWEFLFKNKEILRIEFVYHNGEKKTLRKRQRLLGVLIDSLADIAANKVITYLDRREPKDLFDIYYLLTRAKFTPQDLLQLVFDKFGVEISESTFWSEAFKTLVLLPDLKPFMLETKENKKDDLIAEINNYFDHKSRQFLENILR